MKLLLSAILCNLFFWAAAQKNILPFGKIDKEDLTIKDCDFDKGAEAMILIDEGKTYYTQNSSPDLPLKTIFERRTRIKILNAKGLSFANLHIPFYSHNNTEKINNIKACVYSLSANGTINTIMADKKTVYEKRIDNYYSEIILAFPDVTPGCVIEYKYKMEIEDIGKIKDWFFQGTIPVRYSSYQLNIPQAFRFIANPKVTDDLKQAQKVIAEIIIADKKVISTQSLQSVYTMRNLPGIKYEPFMSTPKDYMQRIEFQLSQIYNGHGDTYNLRKHWSDVVKDLMEDEDFGAALTEEVTGTTALVEKARQIADTEKRMQFLYDFVRRNIVWDKTQSIYAKNGLGKTWNTKTGNNADINLLLIKLFTDAGITAAPVLFSTRSNGYVNTNFPHLDQFNTVMVYVNTATRFFVLDATDKYTNYRLPPVTITNLRGFIVTGERGEWKTFFSGNYTYKNITAAKFFVEKNGKINGELFTSSFDYARNERYRLWKEGTGLFKSTYYGTAESPYKVENISIANADNDSLPFEQRAFFSGVSDSAGGYLYFNPDFFTGFEINPFTATDRNSDIEFGYKQEYSFYSNYSIPDNYTFENLPQNISLIMPDTSIVFTRLVLTDENILTIRTTIDFRKPYYSAVYYPDFAAFYKKMFAKLNEQIVLKKKND